MLTETQIKAATKRATARSLSDGAGGRGTGSLVLQIRPASAGVTALWFARWQHAGRPQKMALGRWPEASLKDARARFAADVRDVIAAGGNPRTAARTANAPTVERLFSAYVAHMRAAGRTSWPEVERALLTGAVAAADGLGRQVLAGDVGSADVAALLGRVYKRGSRVMADRLRAYLSAAFNWAAKAANDYREDQRQDWGVRANPVALVPRDTAAARAGERSLTAAELRTVWHGIAGPGFAAETTAAVRMMICCGQRARETLRMDGADVDVAARLWTMPAEKTKGGKRPHVVPLPDLPLETLRPLLSNCEHAALFPAQGGAGVRMSDGSVSRALRRLQASHGMRPFQMRDLRRTWKSRAADAGVDRFTRDLIQQHAQGDTGSKHYDRADYLPQMRAAMDKWNAWLADNVTG